MGSLNDRAPSNSAGRPFVTQYTVTTGANANTNVAVAGIRLGVDEIDAVIQFTAGVPSNVAGFSVTSAGNIQSANSTSGNAVLVIWRKRQVL